jgi:5,10-methylenetetrahydromethanopterin reductase
MENEFPEFTLERIALGFNPTISASEAANYARLAEERGFESFWVHENPFIRDAVSLISSAISTTSKIRVGSGCVSVITRHPLLATTTFVALNEMSGGRVTMGVGLGGFPWLPKIGVKVFPVQETKPLRRIKEFLTITNGLLSGESVTLDGEFFKVKDLKLEAKPSTRLATYLAAFGPQLLSMAPKVADGVIISPAVMTPEITAPKVKIVREANGRKIDVASYVLTTVSKDEAEARKLMKSYYFVLYQVSEVLRPEVFEPYGLKEKDLEPIKEAWKKKDLAAAARAMPDGVIEALTITGSPDHCLDRLKDYRKVGVELPILMPIGDIKAAMDTFGQV